MLALVAGLQPSKFDYEQPMTVRRRRSLRLLKWLVGLLVAGVTTALLVLGAVYLTVAADLPDVDELRDVELQEPLRVYSTDGDLLAEYGSKRRIPLTIDDVPQRLKQAFVAAEDDRFYSHPGVDWFGLTRAAWNLLLTGEKSQGGSTITMQVARNFFLTRERTYIRKIREIFLALQMEQELSKDKILELYLNKIFLGNRAYGVGAAAETYFGKSVGELTLAESALIAGLPTAPSRYNPVASPRHATGRRAYVLRRMHELDMISTAEYEAAKATPVTTRLHGTPVVAEASYIGEMARLEAAERFGDDVYTGGYKVYTTVETGDQRSAVDALRGSLMAYERRHGYRGPAAEVDSERLPAVADLRQRIATADIDVIEEDGGVVRVREDEQRRYGPFDLDEVLDETGAFGNLEPAVVLAVGDSDATIYRRRGRIDDLAFTTMEWARRVGDEGERGAAPEEPADVVDRGDVIYVEPKADNELAFAQAPQIQGALVALDPDDGSIRALMGGYAFDRSKFNRVTQARRQPGSAFKPFIFSAALNNGYTAATLVNDAPVVFDDPALEDTWRPENYSGRVFGPTRLREALVHSRNLVSIRLLLQIGIANAVDYIERFGFPAKSLPRDLTLALGSGALTPLQLTTGYTTFANGGYRVEPYLIERIEDRDGEEIYTANPAQVCPPPCEEQEDFGDEGIATIGGDDDVAVEADAVAGADDAPEELRDVGVPDRDATPGFRIAERAIDERNAYIVRSMLRDVIRRGTGQRARSLGRDDIGGKTGTTDDQLDAWFVGFQDSLAASAWVGYDELTPLGERETGSRAALPMWTDFMGGALANTEEYWPNLPGDMVTVRIDSETGEYADSGASGAFFEVFREDNAPEEPAAGEPRDDDNGDNGSLF